MYRWRTRSMYACMYVCVFLCMFGCMYVCSFVCMVECMDKLRSTGSFPIYLRTYLILVEEEDGLVRALAGLL